MSEPTDEMLKQFYDAHQELFRDSSTVTFTHIYFSPDKNGSDDAHRRAIAALQTLNYQLSPPQRAPGMGVWEREWTTLRVPMLEDLQADPFERAEDESEGYRRWQVEHLYLLVPAQAYVAKFLATFRDFPQRQKVGSFSLDKVLEQLQQSKNN